MSHSYQTIELSAVPLRKEPSDRSEMTSQILYGERLHPLETQEKWVMVRNMEDSYEGWIDRKQLIEAIIPETCMIVEPMCQLTNQTGDRIWLPAGAQIPIASSVLQIGGRHFDAPDSVCRASPTDIVQYARQFLGAPYLWGGRTVAGIDCSGYTQTIAKVFGKKIPRDAYQQAEEGTTISFIEECQNGDLAFFDNTEGRITHVGLVVRHKDKTHILHASGMVREDLLDHQGIFNASRGLYTHSLRIIKRI